MGAFVGHTQADRPPDLPAEVARFRGFLGAVEQHGQTDSHSPDHSVLGQIGFPEPHTLSDLDLEDDPGDK